MKTAVTLSENRWTSLWATWCVHSLIATTEFKVSRWQIVLSSVRMWKGNWTWYASASVHPHNLQASMYIGTGVHPSWWMRKMSILGRKHRNYWSSLLKPGDRGEAPVGTIIKVSKILLRKNWAVGQIWATYKSLPKRTWRLCKVAECFEAEVVAKSRIPWIFSENYIFFLCVGIRPTGH